MEYWNDGVFTNSIIPQLQISKIILRQAERSRSQTRQNDVAPRLRSG